MTGSAYENIIYSVDNYVATITLNRPEKKNAFNTGQYDDVRRALDASLDDSAVHVVVITGAPGAFSAGHDVGDFLTGPDIPDDGEEHGFPPFVRALIGFDKPLIAAVNGVAVGIGLTMLLHCDFVLVAESARLRAPFVSLGIMPEAGSSLLLPRLAGRQAAAEVLMAGRWLTAERAREIGLAWKVVPDEELESTAGELARELAELPIRPLRRAKRLLQATDADLLSDALEREGKAGAESAGSPENVEAVRAFMEKRKPDFRQFD